MRPGTFSTEKLSHTALPVAHVDRDDVTGENGMRELLSDRAEDLLAKGVRYAQVNVWRTIGEPIQRWPLCFVNHRDVKDWHYKTHMAKVYPENDPRVAIRGEKSHDSVLKHDPKYVSLFSFFFSLFTSFRRGGWVRRTPFLSVTDIPQKLNLADLPMIW